jgi:hypothetical protein
LPTAFGACCAAPVGETLEILAISGS